MWTYGVEIWVTGPPEVWDHPADSTATTIYLTIDPLGSESELLAYTTALDRACSSMSASDVDINPPRWD